MTCWDWPWRCTACHFTAMDGREWREIIQEGGRALGVEVFFYFAFGFALFRRAVFKRDGRCHGHVGKCVCARRFRCAATLATLPRRCDECVTR
ncbi:hypothetical protein BS50DRAFT_220984 [Corynespora cassiicola Philippines]|uniref:Uncharacterized protein n=1 Tax=Corynespora cassiicola Philippines TaxID=1448308 RepID=A0A2T2N352_CORCC|nr:hypothetical protein BS50DRAFT_220984 [Corynespora cassiicola Philippines]